MPPCTALPSTAAPSLSVSRARDVVEASPPSLVTTADHPLLSPAIVDGLLAVARASAIIGAQVVPVRLPFAEAAIDAIPARRN
jgi:hypothetical protein